MKTAEEFFKSTSPNQKYGLCAELNHIQKRMIFEIMRRFAKLHCTEQARVINKLDFEDLPENELANDFEENRALAIENAYSLNLIK